LYCLFDLFKVNKENQGDNVTSKIAELISKACKEHKNHILEMTKKDRVIDSIQEDII